MKNIIVTEKPSVARQFAHALHVSGSHDGYIENDKWIITWAVGHLVTLSYPEKYDERYKQWNLEDLPFLPSEYKYEILPKTRPQFQIVKELLNRPDVDIVYNAGDSAREGEYVQRLIYDKAGINGKKKILRVWIDSQTDEEILKGIKNAKPSEEYDSLSDSAYMRAIADYSMGINLSRALTKKFGYEFNKKAETGKYTPISVGRVMTCTLGMIVRRELEIRNFKPTEFFKIDADHGAFSSHWKSKDPSDFYEQKDLYDASGFREKGTAEKLISKLNENMELIVTGVEKKREKKNAPLLFNLAELQSECSKLFKISPDRTLEVAQKLYEAKLTTYPRTDARVLSTAVAKEIQENIDGVSDILPEYGDIITKINGYGTVGKIASTKYCDDSKISDHYAIIPTGQGNTDGLSGLEKDIYIHIVKRFLAIFCPPAEYDKATVAMEHNTGEKFHASASVLVSKGYLELYGTSETGKETAMDADTLTKGSRISAKFRLVESSTQPPKRYTSGTMILAMENAGKLIEEEELREQIKGSGIGTSATRAETIKKLAGDGYIQLNDKTQVITPSKTGEVLYDIVFRYLPDMLDPKLTANWEQGLTRIVEKTLTVRKYREVFENDIRKKVELIKAQTAESAPQAERKETGECPICGKTMFTSKFGWICSGYKKSDPASCHFAIPYEIAGHKLTENEMNTLRSGKDTEEIDDFVSKTGKKFSSKIVIQNGKTGFPQRPHEDTQIKCPKCGKPLIKDQYSYRCQNGDIQIWRTIGGIELTDSDISSLLDNRYIGPLENLTTKEGKKYSAYLIFRRNALYQVSSEISGHKISSEDISALIKNGKTEELDFFSTKKNKDFKAVLKLSDGYAKMEFAKKKG